MATEQEQLDTLYARLWELQRAEARITNAPGCGEVEIARLTQLRKEWKEVHGQINAIIFPNEPEWQIDPVSGFRFKDYSKHEVKEEVIQ